MARRCHYCNAAPGTTRDHIVPRSLGGPNAQWNIVRACGPCNNDKASSWPECPCGVCQLAVEMFLWAKERGLGPWPPGVFTEGAEAKARNRLLIETFEVFKDRLWEERITRAELWEDAKWLRTDHSPWGQKAMKPPRPGTPEYEAWHARQEWDEQGFLKSEDAASMYWPRGDH